MRYIITISTFLLASATVSSQSFLNARSTGMASDIGSAFDLPSMYSNPAGLSNVRDLQLNNTNGLITSSTSQGIFGNVSVGYRFLPSHVGAFSYAPSRVLNFNFFSKSDVEVNEIMRTIITNISSKRLKYQETVRLGYAYRPVPGLSFGLTSQLQKEDVEEDLTTIQTRENIPTTTKVSRDSYSASAWNFDAGFIYTFSPSISLGFVANNLFTIRESSLPDRYLSYALVPQKIIRAGAALRPLEDFMISTEVDSRWRASIGFEMNAYSPSTPFVLRGGLWFDAKNTPAFYALSTGFGYTYKFITLDASYLLFTNKHLRGGSVSETDFTPITNVEFNQYSSDRLSASVSIALGTLRDVSARIEYVEMVNPVFPASYRIHATRPLGYARVRNLTDEPIQVRLQFFARKLMDTPTESQPFYLAPEEVKDLPFTAEFNESILSVRNETMLETQLGVAASHLDNLDDRVRTKLLVHGRNSWNGDPVMLKYFVTPTEDKVVQFARRALSENRDYLESVPAVQRKLEQARMIFNKLSRMLTYVADPRTSDQMQLETVQYPEETLDYRSGDCDDLTVCYSSLLNSLGFETAFVDVTAKEKNTEGNSAHLYLLFDTAVPASEWQRITNNEKKIIMRKNSTGNETVWIPVETTVIVEGFDVAWEKGSLEYLQDVEVDLGLIRGSVKILDVY